MRDVNWIDAVIIFIIGLTALQGWVTGFVRIGVMLLSFLGSLWFAIFFQRPVGGFFSEKFGITPSWSDVLAYVVIAVFMQQLLAFAGVIAVQYVPKKVTASRWNNVLGVLASSLNGGVVIAFVLTLIMLLPLRGTIQQDIKSSLLGHSLVRLAEQYGGQITSVLDDASFVARRFMTIKPRSNERVELDMIPEGASYLENAEDEETMLGFINRERERVGEAPLAFSEDIAVVARAYGKDMLMRRFFSHISPEGENAGDRLIKAKIRFSLVGENLAYAPDVTVAHDGLMESEGHRRNILEKEFGKVGIGVIDAGIYGKIFVQVFSD